MNLKNKMLSLNMQGTGKILVHLSTNSNPKQDTYQETWKDLNKIISILYIFII